MTQIELIRAKIERLMKWKPKAIPSGMCQRDVLNIRKSVLLTLKDFINSLPAEQPSERLGDEIDHFRCSDEFALAKRAGEEVAATARHFAQWQKEQSTKLLKTIYSDCDNLKKDLDRVTTGNLPHRIGNIKFSITGIQVIIKQAMEDEQ